MSKPTKEERREKRLKQVYNLSQEDYNRILAFQCGACAICASPPKPGKALHIEHNHVTGQIRGLVDWRCNRLLGVARDSSLLLEAAAAYLSQPPATQALGGARFGLPGRVGTKKQRKLVRKLAKQAIN